MKLAGELSCSHSPHMCREFDRAQYWFHTSSEVSISWSHMNSVFTSCRTGCICTQRDLNVCCLTHEAEGKRAVKVLIRLWRAEVVLLFFFLNERYPANCISLQSWSSWHFLMLVNTWARQCAMKERGKITLVVWCFYVFACGSVLLFIKNYFMVKHARNVTISDSFSNGIFFPAFSLCVFAWGSQESLPIAKKQMGISGYCIFGIYHVFDECNVSFVFNTRHFL